MRQQLWQSHQHIADVGDAALLHGISGMGFSLITIAAISESYPLSEAIILVLLPTALLNASAWLGGKGRIRYHLCHYLSHYWQLVLLSLVGGIVGGATNAMVPVLMMYLLSVSNDKNTIIRVSNLCFFTEKLAQFIVLFGEFTELDGNGWQLFATIAALSLLFMLLGAQLERFLPTRMFRLLILWILILLGWRLGYYAVLSLS